MVTPCIPPVAVEPPIVTMLDFAIEIVPELLVAETQVVDVEVLVPAAM